jgi:sugar (pentulose or hexulose) kinase
MVKGGFYNMVIGHIDADMLRAVMEGVAFAEKERIGLLTDAGCRFSSMCISGGGASIDIWCQIKTDIINMPVSAFKDVDAAELGAAMVAGVGVGVFQDFEEAALICRPKSIEFLPDEKKSALYEQLYGEFKHIENKLSEQ